MYCGREMHQICVLHYDHIWSEGYQCNGCLKAKSLSRKENKLTAKRKCYLLLLMLLKAGSPTHGCTVCVHHVCDTLVRGIISLLWAGLPVTKLSMFLEEKVNGFLRTQGPGTPDVIIRVVSSSDKILDTRPLMRDRFQVGYYGCVGGCACVCSALCVCGCVCSALCVCGCVCVCVLWCVYCVGGGGGIFVPTWCKCLKCLIVYCVCDLFFGSCDF